MNGFYIRRVENLEMSKLAFVLNVCRSIALRLPEIHSCKNYPFMHCVTEKLKFYFLNLIQKNFFRGILLTEIVYKIILFRINHLSC